MTFLEQLIQLDQQTTLWLNLHGPAFLDPVWNFMSLVSVWIPLYVLVIAYMFWRVGWKKALILLLALALAIALTDQVSYHVKEFLQRLRPCHNPWMLDNGLRLPAGVKNSLYGFFSGHACNTFGFATFTYVAFKKNDPPHSYTAWGWVIFLWAALIAVSRVMLGAHFLGDILVGILFGILVGWSMASLSHYIIVKAKV